MLNPENAGELQMTKLSATVVSVHAGSNDDMSKDEHPSIEVDLYVTPAWLERAAD